MRSAVIQQWILVFGLTGLFADLTGAQTIVVPRGAVWNYLDDGSDQGTAWQGLLFNDLAWAAGPAQFGYGDGDEATIVNAGPPANPFVTTYYRHAFPVVDPLAFTNLSVRLLRDGGGVVYLNGTEVFRSNMPTNDINYLTLASDAPLPLDQSTNFYPHLVDPALLIGGLNLLAVEIHQFSLSRSNNSFDLALVGNVPETLPTVVLTGPSDGTNLTTANIILAAEAYEPGDVIAQVEFFQGGSSLGKVALPPYSLVWSNVPQGSYALTAVATDSRGLSSTSAPVMIIAPALIATGTTWSYLDDGSDQGAAWQGLAFDDNGWATGPAQLGFGSADDVTVINGGPSTNRIITYYFRHRFSVLDPTAWTNLVVRLLRDDGGIVYLNGTEIFRSNMPDGPVDYLTWAASVVPKGPQESEFYASQVDVALLVPGENVLTVEIHQANNTSSDLNFDLELIPNVAPALPTVGITSITPLAGGFVAPATLEIAVDAKAYDSTIAQVQVYLGTNILGTSTDEPFSLVASNVSAGQHTLQAVAITDLGTAATSAPVAFTVIGAPLVATLVATGSIWKYLDTGPTNQGTLWKEAGFDDSQWASGPAILGYGGAKKTPPRPEATLINSTNAAGKIMAAYFRQQFVISAAASYTNLAFRVLRDDGVVAYLNGAEIFRMNMPTGAISYATTTPSPTTGTNETHRFPTNISPALLVDGTNLLAIELHQYTVSSDAAFDLDLTGIGLPPNAPMSLSITNKAGGLLISWQGNGGVLEYADQSVGPWFTVTSALASPYWLMPSNRAKFYRLRQP